MLFYILQTSPSTMLFYTLQKLHSAMLSYILQTLPSTTLFYTLGTSNYQVEKFTKFGEFGRHVAITNDRILESTQTK
jgi:hypothetical protein